MSQSSVAIITARGGSKRIPKKNIKEFCGKPILVYSIEAAINSGCFDEVMVSTDSDEIAKIAKKYGAKVPFLRDEAMSNDYATTADVLEGVLHQYRVICSREFQIMCCLYPTAPFVTAEKLKAAMSAFLENNPDSLFPVVRFGFPPQRGMVIRNGRLQYLHPENECTRSQDLEPIYHDCGQFYICKVTPFLKAHSLVMDSILPFFIPEEEVQDIDTLSDWHIAEIKYQRMIEKEN